MTSYKSIATKYGITPEQVKQLQWAMADTWSAIGCEWIACFESEQQAYDAFNSEADMVAEATIDADRIKMYSDSDLTWFYDLSREQVPSRLKLAEDAWNCS
jgi:hypothetical protein